MERFQSKLKKFFLGEKVLPSKSIRFPPVFQIKLASIQYLNINQKRDSLRQQIGGKAPGYN